MELLLHQHDSSISTKTSVDVLAGESNALCVNLENHIGSKVKVSFMPNQYYNEKIYVLTDYSVTRHNNGLDITMSLKEGNINAAYKIEGIVKIEHQEYFNRIEYKAHISSSEIIQQAYHFCLYY